MFDRIFESDLLWFTLPALVGSGVFAIKMVMMLLGGDADSGDLGDGDADFGAHADDASGHAFDVLSVQSISVFSMGFGWVGLACVMGAGLSHGASLAFGLLGGVLMIWILARSLGAMHQLESSGNVAIGDTLGLEGEVYASVPAAGSGRGQIQLVVGANQRMYNAVSQSAQIETRTRVRVVGVNSDNTLTVEAV